MVCFRRLRRKITAVTAILLGLSVIKTVYEFQTAQRPKLGLGLDNGPPFLPHILLTPTPASRSNLSGLSGILWPVSRERVQSHVSSADTKINTDSIARISHEHQGHRATLLSLPLGVQLPAYSSAGISSANKTLPYLLIIVCSKPENTEYRLAIRRSWGLELDKSEVVLRFIVGQDDDWNDIIKREEFLHGDVIRTDYLDTYQNLSRKVLAAMHWALHSTVKLPQYVMKIDDDTYVNVPYLLFELRHNHPSGEFTRNYVMGAVCVDSPVVRDDGDKWFVSYLDYPSDMYPTYVFGGGYVLTKEAVSLILKASQKADYLHLEDVFITGILARAAGIRHVSHPGFSFWASKQPSPCDLVTGRRLTAVNLTWRQFYTTYSAVHALLRTGNWTKC